MPEIETPVAPEETSTGYALEQRLSQEETSLNRYPHLEVLNTLDPIVWRRELQNPKVDRDVFHNIESLRETIEIPGGWKALKEKAYTEAEKLSDNSLEELCTIAEPFLPEMSAGHSIGHFERDAINLALLLLDPEIRNKTDRVELIVGIFGGMFHDIGNAVVKRYDDNKNFAGHAEVGAYLFGKIAKNVFKDAPHLLQLIQYSIAAHTHYDRDITITRTIDDVEVEEVRRKYVGHDKVEGKDKQGISEVRKVDRFDFPFLWIRHPLTKTVPTADYSGEGEFHEATTDEKEDFKLQFSTRNRTEGERKKALTKAEQNPNVLEHVNKLFKSFFEKNIYTTNDTRYFTKTLIKPYEKDFKAITDAVTGKWVSPMTEEQQNEAFNNYYIMCYVFEQGNDIQLAIQQFQQKFPLLTPDERLRWATGFRFLTTKFWPEWYTNMKKQLEKLPKVSDDKNAPEQKLALSVNKQAKKFLDNFNPNRLQQVKDDLGRQGTRRPAEMPQEELVTA